MKHYLVTLWNVDLYDLGWLQRRQALFERYTIPSVEGQTNKNFEWILISDARTPDQFKNVLDHYPAKVVYQDWTTYEWKNLPDMSKMGATMQRAIKLETIGDVIAGAIGSQSVDYVMTSRLDNDDIIAKNHIDRMQFHAALAWEEREERKFWLSLVRGYRLCNGNFYPFNSRANSFLSFVENPNDLKTCYHCVHTLERKSEYPSELIRSGEPTWAEVIHSENVMNRLKRYRGEKAARTELRERFNINE